jgi:transposase
MTRMCTRTTAAGAPCTRAALPDTVPPVCVSHSGVVGPKFKLSPAVQSKLLAVLRTGAHVETACAAAGIGRSTIYEWLRRGDPEGTAPANAQFRDFAEAVERARGEGEALRTARIVAAAVYDWHAAAWLLERGNPEKWGKPGRRVVDRATADPDDDGPVAA